MVARITLIFVIAAGLAGNAAAQTSRLVGHINFPEKTKLTRTAVLEVTLEDVSTDAGGVVASTRIPRPGQTPIMFYIEYDAARVVPARRYAVRAQIVDGAATLFESDKPVRVLTQGASSVATVTLVEAAPKPAPVPEPKMEPAPKAMPAPKPSPEPKVEAPKPSPEPKATPAPKSTPAPKPSPEPKVEAPKPSPEPKATPAPKSTPAPKPSPEPKVEAPKPSPEPKATPAPKSTPAPKPSPEPKAEAPKPSPEPKATPAPKSTPEPKVAPASPAPAPSVAPSSTAAAFGGGEWTLTEIEAKTVRPADKTHRKIVLTFDPATGRFSGTSGCNNLAGRFTVVEQTLTFKSDKSLQICRVDQRTERGVRGVIEDTRSYRMAGNTLVLLDDKGKLLAKLER